jgi:hypothetical protein
LVREGSEVREKSSAEVHGCPAWRATCPSWPARLARGMAFGGSIAAEVLYLVDRVPDCEASHRSHLSNRKLIAAAITRIEKLKRVRRNCRNR